MRRPFPLLVLLPLVLAACNGSDALPLVSQAAPEFQLQDVNPNSATNSATTGQPVSPRDYTGTVTAWYFGSAT